MFKLPLRPFWIGLLALPIAAFVAFRVAVALTAFTPANQPIGYVAQDEITSFNLKSGNEVVFRGQYEREFWSGTILAYKADNSANLTGGSAWWTDDAGGLMNAQNYNTGRFIATMKDDGTPIAFRVTSLSSAQQAFLTSDNILNYLRGDRANEIPAAGGTMRQRISVMGDVVHSRPFYVADATNPTVFVGANDGMLHAINANSEVNDPSRAGRERWAYVPSMLLSKMKKLTVDPYVHDFFVNGQINVATIASGTKRVLVGGLGAGGKGLYALDITGSSGLTATNETEVAAKVKWEITPDKVNYATPSPSDSYANLGYTYGTVTIAKVNVSGTATDAVIVGNGYNDGGDYGSYLYVINADTGAMIKRFKAGSGTVTSPNGLSTPVAIDQDNNGMVDTVYAGDLNGSMWKFDLSDLSDRNAVATTSNFVSLLLTTSPAQAITSTPGVAIHPEGGYMVTFGTGKVLVDADLADSAVHYAYGIWDGAPVANAVLLPQTLTERIFVNSTGTARVRSATSNQPVWTSGAANHKGWKLALPAGERVLGEGSFIENGRFYFTGSNPTIATTIPSTSSVVKGEAWLMELDYLTGGSKNLPFLDLSGNVKLDNDDRIKYTASDTIPTGSAVGDPILTTDGIAVGKFISIGLLSQPILVQLVTLNDTLFNQNPDIVVPYPQLNRGVEGGHFDVEIYYGPSVSATSATASITVGTAGQTSPFPATLGAITVNGVEVVPALVVTDLPDGGIASTNAETIRSKVKNGFTATRSGSVITIKAPLGAAYNGATLSVAAGSAQALVSEVRTSAVAPTRGTLVITQVDNDSRRVSIKCGSTYVTGAPGDIRSIDDTAGRRLADLFVKISGPTGAGLTVNGYTTSCTKTGLAASPTALTCSIAAPLGASACSGGFSTARMNVSTNTGPAGGSNGSVSTAQSGWTNFAPALTTTAFSGAADASVSGNTCNNGNDKCSFKVHTHEYDDIYDKTGVNFLSASDPTYNLSNAVPSLTTQFKVLAHNQYLSPAAKLHIGNSGYNAAVDFGYVSMNTYQTSSTLDLASVPTYTRATIGSLTINLPTDAFTNKNWWGGVNGLASDVRDGLHPTEYGCVVVSASATQDGNLYQPVIPPATVTATGNGTRGWSSTTTQLTATGVRHNGALTLQIIKANTPNSAIEQNVSGRPEYGWRVKAADFATYVIAEYAMFHHTKHLGLCYGDTGWTKTPAVDTRTCGAVDSTTTKKCAVPVLNPPGSDPSIGDLSAGGGTVVSSVTTIVGAVTTTTITYSDSRRATITRTVNDDGSVTIVTVDADGNRTTQTTANAAGGNRTGGDERGLQARTGRISWRELVAP